MDKKCRHSIFNAFIVSNFSYCNVIWHNCSNHDMCKMEKLQKRALRIIFNDYTSTYAELLDQAKCPSLYVSRMRAIAIETYKCLHGINPPFICELLVEKSPNYCMRDCHKVVQPKVRTEMHGINSFRYQSAKIWNSLPVKIKRSNSLAEFKSNIKQWNVMDCTCGFCKLCRISVM